MNKKLFSKLTLLICSFLLITATSVNATSLFLNESSIAASIDDSNNGKVSEQINTENNNIATNSAVATVFRVLLRVDTESQTHKVAHIYYYFSGSLGIDNNDAVVFTNYPFDIYSRLINGEFPGQDFQNQTLPDSNFEEMVVPIGLNATINSEIKFSFEFENQPAGINVYFEDREQKTLTLITGSKVNGTNEEAITEYTATTSVTSTDGNTGIGRFFLHTSANPIKIATGTDWNTATNWNPNGIPEANENVVIPDGITMSISSGNAVANNTFVKSGAALTIDPSANLTLTTGSITIDSDVTKNGSFIGKSYGGNIKYNRYVDTDWHIISSMVTNQNLNTFATNVANNITNKEESGNTKYALGPYSTSANAWTYYNSSNIGSAGNFMEGVGYAAQKNTAGVLSFIGANRVTDAGTTIAANSGTSIGFRSLGNPYPSYIPINTDDNFITTNSAALKTENKAIYIYENLINKYEPIVDSDADRYLAPGQGFLIKTNSGGGTISIPQTMQSHQTGTTFSRTTSTITRIIMSLTDGTNFSKSKVFYSENGSKGIDDNDAGVFANYDFDIYSKLVDGTYADTDFFTQTLPNSDYETMIVPIGVKAEENTQITFNFTHEALPAGYMIFLEDRELGTFTRVDNGSNYITTSNTNGIGRFYLHTTTSTLATQNTTLPTTTIYSNHNSIQIKGLSLGTTEVTLFDVLGRVIFKDRFTDKNSYEISTNKLTKSNFYIVYLQTLEGTLSKKVIINK
ncbi:T9SS type A sorting domain-containing protein [Polaribacter sp.]|uniref:T9SS type A sorting domain-containing protein n=1 Tax=Polaribacter sp. TaxID=1920175 RepID=UPI003EF6E386